MFQALLAGVGAGVGGGPRGHRAPRSLQTTAEVGAHHWQLGDRCRGQYLSHSKVRDKFYYVFCRKTLLNPVTAARSLLLNIRPSLLLASDKYISLYQIDIETPSRYAVDTFIWYKTLKIQKSPFPARLSRWPWPGTPSRRWWGCTTARPATTSPRPRSWSGSRTTWHCEWRTREIVVVEKNYIYWSLVFHQK